MGLTRFAGFVRGNSDGILTSTPFFSLALPLLQGNV
jgi:hypothetical protein